MKNRNNWIDAFMTLAGFMFCIGLLMTGRGYWMFTLIFFALAALAAAGAAIAKYGITEIMALPQAIWMCLQDRRERKWRRVLRK